MAELHEILAERLKGWRTSAYVHETHAAIGEVLLYARNEDGSPRYLREPQIRALETYWYLRLVARRHDEVEGEHGVKAKALRELEERNPGRVAYRVVFADEFVSQADLAAVRDFVSP